QERAGRQAGHRDLRPAPRPAAQGLPGDLGTAVGRPGAARCAAAGDRSRGARAAARAWPRRWPARRAGLLEVHGAQQRPRCRRRHGVPLRCAGLRRPAPAGAAAGPLPGHRPRSRGDRPGECRAAVLGVRGGALAAEGRAAAGLACEGRPPGGADAVSGLRLAWASLASEAPESEVRALLGDLSQADAAELLAGLTAADARPVQQLAWHGQQQQGAAAGNWTEVV
ncbi:unnamed protein product, partial [Prorocentrum cordatum]